VSKVLRKKETWVIREVLIDKKKRGFFIGVRAKSRGRRGTLDKKKKVALPTWKLEELVKNITVKSRAKFVLRKKQIT